MLACWQRNRNIRITKEICQIRGDLCLWKKVVEQEFWIEKVFESMRDQKQILRCPFSAGSEMGLDFQCFRRRGVVWGVHITKCHYSRFRPWRVYFIRVQIATHEFSNKAFLIDHLSSVGHRKENLSHTFWRVTSQVFKTPSTLVIFFLISDISAGEKYF